MLFPWLDSLKKSYAEFAPILELVNNTVDACDVTVLGPEAPVAAAGDATRGPGATTDDRQIVRNLKIVLRRTRERSSSFRAGRPRSLDSRAGKARR